MESNFRCVHPSLIQEPNALTGKAQVYLGREELIERFPARSRWRRETEASSWHLRWRGSGEGERK